MNDVNEHNQSPRHWYVAVVNHNSERKAAQRLSSDDCECYVASQSQVRVSPAGRRRTVERVVIPALLFIRCTEHTRLRVVSTPFIYRFLTNRAGAPNPYGKPVAIIPDEQIQQLQFMLGHSERPVEMVERAYAKGQRVEVVRGPLRGLQGVAATDTDGHAFIYVDLDLLGAARTKIPLTDIQPAT